MDILDHYPEVRSEWLMRGIEPMFNKPEPKPEAKEGAYTGMPYAVTVDTHGQEVISLVSVKAEAGYLLARNVDDTMGDLETLSIPGIRGGKSVRAFEVAGNSMQPTLNQGDLVVASYTERLDLIQPKHVYVVVAHDRIMVKRLRGPVKRHEPIELLSDNRFYDPFVLPQNDLKELWQVQAVLTRSVPANTNDSFDRMLVLLEMLAQDSQHLRSILLDVAARYDVKLVGEAS
ncbi:S24 family peptidase [Hymenobacter sp. BT770]|uniref:S24 family peptidase n=1 Tax=Hymenobacter sp. BT770 TaxID=2886942 RepID=UPI001D110D4C|nr:S24 family peptidase [Hymenobacter sp. BT770]MCC3154607.1 S24 family peptidase [Hymenobacter sp. BT770]MDO3416661.1 S24 family peptidase [Hymenobacter sp. BT770]